MARVSLCALFLITMGLQCFCWNTVSCRLKTFKVTLESFARQDRPERFLRTIQNGANFSVSFTGVKGQPSTKFICKREWTDENVFYTLQPAEMPDYILAEDNGKLVVKKSTTGTVDENCKLQKRRVTLKYIAKATKTMHYEILKFLSSPGKVIKGSCDGKVFLDKQKKYHWRAWIKINQL
ncbi:hypothetical protein ACROYT_G026090 [Oculina patagonica]